MTDDAAFRGTLTLLPLVLAALWWIARWSERDMRIVAEKPSSA